MGRRGRFSPEVRERAVRLVFEHTEEHDSQWGAIRSVAEKIGCSAETLRKWVRQGELYRRFLLSPCRGRPLLGREGGAVTGVSADPAAA